MTALAIETVVAVTGYPGSGKTTACRHLVQMDFASVSTGELMRKRYRGEREADESYYSFVDRIIKAEGPALNDQALANEIENLFRRGLSGVIVDGLRTTAQILALRASFARFSQLWLDCPSATRWARLGARARSSDISDGFTFAERDSREERWGLADLRLTADITIDNSGSLDRLREQLDMHVRR